MKILSLLILAILACTARAFPPDNRPKYQTDSGTVGFLRKNLLSGGDLQYPYEVDRLKQQGSGFFVMKLRPDGSVESLIIKSSTRNTVLDEHVQRTLKTYRFKPKTKGPLLWLVSFLQPTTVLVQVSLFDERNPPFIPK